MNAGADPVRLWEAARSHRAIVIEAGAGAGKSSALEFLAARAVDELRSGGQGGVGLPVLPRTQAAPAPQQDNRGAVVDALGGAGAVGAVVPWDHLILLIDGLNEVGDGGRVDFLTEMRDLLGRWPALRVVLTAREHWFCGEFEASKFTLRPFTPEQFLELMIKLRGDEADARRLAEAVLRDPSLAEWASNPFHATLIGESAGGTERPALGPS
jgi:hypothetical protein